MIIVPFCFSSQHKYETHECCVQIKPKIVCPKLKQIKFKNQYKQQEVNNVIFSDIKCYMKGSDENILVAIHIRYLNMYLLLLAIVGIAKMNCLAKMKYITDPRSGWGTKTEGPNTNQGTCLVYHRPSLFADHTMAQTASKIMLEIY